LLEGGREPRAALSHLIPSADARDRPLPGQQHMGRQTSQRIITETRFITEKLVELPGGVYHPFHS